MIRVFIIHFGREMSPQPPGWIYNDMTFWEAIKTAQRGARLHNKDLIGDATCALFGAEIFQE